MAYIQSYKERAWLLPPSIEDMIPDDHICFLVESLVESLDYREFDICLVTDQIEQNSIMK